MCSKHKDAKVFENHLNPVTLIFIGKALPEYPQMSNHMPGFRSIFQVFASFCIGQISHTSSLRVKDITVIIKEWITILIPSLCPLLETLLSRHCTHFRTHISGHWTHIWTFFKQKRLRVTIIINAPKGQRGVGS